MAEGPSPSQPAARAPTLSPLRRERENFILSLAPIYGERVGAHCASNGRVRGPGPTRYSLHTLLLLPIRYSLFAPFPSQNPDPRLHPSLQHQIAHRPDQRIEPVGAFASLADHRTHFIFELGKCAHMRNPALLIESRHRLRPCLLAPRGMRRRGTTSPRPPRAAPVPPWRRPGSPRPPRGRPAAHDRAPRLAWPIAPALIRVTE